MLEQIKQTFSGELYYQNTVEHNTILMSYATDASVYQEKPLGVAIPKNIADIKMLVEYAGINKITLIPRAAGTSLAGQVVGSGLVVDISKNFNTILQINKEEKWVKVEPGVIRDELNKYLKPHGLMFGPETSTSNRAMIGGMIGNNSSGLHSIIWGDTRSNIIEIEAILYDGSTVLFNDLTKEELLQKCALNSAEGKIYNAIVKLISNTENKAAIENGFPDKSINRRNTGYALDAVLELFKNNGLFNLSKLIAGSEGTLCFITSAKLKLIHLPPSEKGIVAIHTTSINEALKANLIALHHHCSASELVDDNILEFTKTNIDQSKNRFFVVGEPKAILMVEFFDDTSAGLVIKMNNLIKNLIENNLGYAYPLLLNEATNMAWDLRKSGLGLLRNEPGDIQPVNLIEDCAVSVENLPDYIDEVESLLKKYSVKYAIYAHAGAGELHVEPMINLKTSAGKILFRNILKETVAIVKKYNGSLSGEHGDGRLRGEFIVAMMGEKNYDLFKEVKNIFDPNGVFNYGKIVNTPPMNEFLRYTQDGEKKQIVTILDFSKQEGILHLAEKCSGSGDCRKTHVSGGTMCPSYMATRNEQDTTRARANILRHFYTNHTLEHTHHVSDKEVSNVLDLCLSCKGCKSECPSGVDVGKIKAEFTQQYYDKYGVPFRSKLIGNFTSQMKLAANFPSIYNFIFDTTFTRRLVNKIVGFHAERSLPLLHKTTLKKWFAKHKSQSTEIKNYVGSVNLFCDEFSDYNDVKVGQKLILLLEALGYNVIIPKHVESGRTYLSKGLLRKAKDIAIKNVDLLKDVVSETIPIIGIEPSAILTLRDEYLELVPFEKLLHAKKIAKNCFLFEEWFLKEIKKGNIKANQFTNEKRSVQLHGHCHQKALSSSNYISKVLSLPLNYTVSDIASGCCGMAGSFGYEKEHYNLSMQIGGLVLFPAINSFSNDVIIAASGTSCRHQIKDGTGRLSQHSAEILYDALSINEQT